MIKVVVGERARAAAMMKADRERAERVKTVGDAVVAALGGGEGEGGGAEKVVVEGAAAAAAAAPPNKQPATLEEAKKAAQKSVKARLQGKVREGDERG